MKRLTDDEIEKNFRKIDEQFDKISRSKADELGYAQLKPIDEKFPYAQNGITAMIAPVGSGKSYNYLKLMAKQEVIFNEPFFELIVICSTSNKFDKTVQTFKNTVKKSKIVPVKDSDLLDYLNEYMSRVFVYNCIMRFVMDGLPWNKLDKEFPDLLELLRKHVGVYSYSNPKTIDKGLKWICATLAEFNWKTYPHRMLLILDDFASHPLLRSKETEMSRLLKKLRHFNINVIICVQTVKSIPKDIKRGLSDIILFPGISEYDFKDLLKEVNMNFIDHELLWKSYKEIDNRHTTVALHLNARRIIISKSSFEEK
jgi:hypothetical protein